MNDASRGIGMTSQRARDRLADQVRAMGVRSERVLELVRTTPRHLFVDEALASRAYENSALPIGHGQTISQPYVVARMTEAVLGDAPIDRALEIGGGCGYQSAILAHLAKRVYVVERIAALARQMRERLYGLRIHNVSVRHGDGMEGWPKYAPYDAVVCAAAPVEVPETLLEQLAQGGRLVLPVGSRGAQELRLIKRTATGYEERLLDYVSFVPMLDGLD